MSARSIRSAHGQPWHFRGTVTSYVLARLMSSGVANANDTRIIYLVKETTRARGLRHRCDAMPKREVLLAAQAAPKNVAEV